MPGHKEMVRRTFAWVTVVITSIQLLIKSNKIALIQHDSGKRVFGSSESLIQGWICDFPVISFQTFLRLSCSLTCYAIVKKNKAHLLRLGFNLWKNCKYSKSLWSNYSLNPHQNTAFNARSFQLSMAKVGNSRVYSEMQCQFWQIARSHLPTFFPFWSMTKNKI